MKGLTQRQMLEFTHDLDKIAVAIGTLRQTGKLGNGQPISITEKDELLISQIRLLRASARFLKSSGTLNSSIIASQLEDLKSASARIEKTLAKVESVQKILNFSMSAVSFAEAVPTGNAILISESLAQLLENVTRIEYTY